MSLLPGDARTAPAPLRSQQTQATKSSSPRWLRSYDDFVTKNAGQVARIESGLRSLTYILPGRFHDAEMASETIHSGVQLLSLYHDRLLEGALEASADGGGGGAVPGPPPSAHARYTRSWARRSALYRRVATVLQVVRYTELLCEMAAKRRGDGLRWRVVVLLEGVKAFCRLVLLYLTRLRPVVTPALPERQPIPDPADDDATADDEGRDYDELLAALQDEDEEGGTRAADEARAPEKANGKANGAANGHLALPAPPPPRPLPPSSGPWPMPRTGLSLPRLPGPGDTSSYLLSRVLTADDIKPASKLLQPLRPYSAAHAAEVLHILAPVVYALALASSRHRGAADARGRRKTSWTPWLVGVALELAARRLREHDPDGGGRRLRAAPLERAEWSGRGLAMGWWAMRGAFYETFTRRLVEGVRARLPGFVGTVMEDYEYLWENYYFSTAS